MPYDPQHPTPQSKGAQTHDPATSGPGRAAGLGSGNPGPQGRGNPRCRPGIKASGWGEGVNRAGGRGALRTTSEDDRRGCGVEGNPRQQPGGGCLPARGMTWAGEGRHPSSALADQGAARSPPPLAVAPQLSSPAPRRESPWRPRSRGRRRQEGAQGSSWGDSPPRRPPGGSRPGRGEGAPVRPPPHDCPGRRALPRSARRSPSCSICEPLTRSGASAPPGAPVLGAARFGLARPSARSAVHPAPRPARAPLLSVAPPLAAAPSRERGQSSARTREGIPRFAVPPPDRPPFPGSAGKNGLERQAREFAAPSRTLLPAAGAQGWQPRARLWTLAQTLCPRSSLHPRPAPRGFHKPEPGLQFQASRGQNRAEGPLETSVSLSASWERDKEPAQQGLQSWPRSPPLRVRSSRACSHFRENTRL